MADTSKGALRALRDGDSGLIYVVWELTLRCDLSCDHCGSRAGKKRDDELTTDEALAVVEELAAMGAREVTLIGGEAYLREDWDVIARAIVDAGMRCTMTSGGRGFTPERARRAHAAKVSSVSISVDGMREAHDLQRGLNGSFDAALASMQTLRDAGVGVSANTQVNRVSLPDLEALLDLWIAHGVSGWQMQLTVPMGRAAEHPDWLLQPYELLEVYPKLAALAERGAAHGVLFWPANNIGYFGPYETILRGRGVHEDRAWSGCVAGKHALGLESNGAVKGCPSLPTSEYVGGNLRERSIREIWDTSRELRFTRDRTTEDLWGFCKGCYYADTCRAGCTWTSHVFFGRAGNNPYCHHRSLERQKAGLRERVVQIASAPGKPFDHGKFEIVVEPHDAPVPAGGTRRHLPLA
jgi:radical SAM protein with 4Fe4S-binding SPASM domain